MTPCRILVTGFRPFAGEAVNPSERAVALLAERAVPGAVLRVLSLPTEFDTCRARVEAALADWPADAVLSVGLAGGRSGLSVERVAINLDDARIPDERGARPIDRPVVPGAPAAYFATVPVKPMVAAIRDAGIEAALSHSAGTFVCNHLFFGLRHLAETRFPGLRAGFVHIPWLPEQAQHRGAPGLDTGTAARGLAAALGAIALGDATPVAAAVSEGALH